MSDQNEVRFFRRCLKCGKETSAENYTCSCGEESWTREYRLVDVKYRLTARQQRSAAQAFEEYDLNHPDGIYQYFFMPHAANRPELPFRVGLTPFYHLPKFSESVGTRVYVKNEGANPSGCFKDRETAMAALHSLAEGKQKAVIYSSGNAAASAALFARHLGIRLITVVAGDTYPEKVQYIRDKGSTVIRIGGRRTSYEEGYRIFAKLNFSSFFADHGFDNWSVRNPYRVIGDKTTAWEIIKQFRRETNQSKAVPDYVVVPTGNGSCLVGIWRGFQELHDLQVINQLPRMVSAAISQASPVVKAFRHKLRTRPAVCDLEGLPDTELEIGSTILAEEGYDSVAATRAVMDSGGLALGVKRREIREALIQLQQTEKKRMHRHKLLPEPASLTTLAVIRRMVQQEHIGPNDSVVALISGHGVKSAGMLLKLLRWHPRLQKEVRTLIREHPRQNAAFRSADPGPLIQVAPKQAALRSAFMSLIQS